MTDRLKGCTVVFEHDIREDDAEQILNAIRCIRNVLKVEPAITVHGDYFEETRVRTEFGRKLLAIVYPEVYGDKK